MLVKCLRGGALIFSPPFVARVVAIAVLGIPVSSHAATYTWDGTSNAWNSAHWLPGPVVGPTAASDIAIINSGTVTFSINDSFGNHATTASPTIVINAGGTLASGSRYNTFISPTLGGGTLLLDGGVNASFPAFGIKGTVTVNGTQASNINVGGGSFNVINIGPASGPGGVIFDVNNVTGDATSDLNVNAPLQNMSGGTAPTLTKIGAGTMTLTAANLHTGGTIVNAGTLAVSGSGSFGASSVPLTVDGATAIGQSRRHVANRRRSQPEERWANQQRHAYRCVIRCRERIDRRESRRR